MATLGDFLQRLFEEGRIVLEGRPVPSEAGRSAALRVLEAAFDRHRLDVAGPPIGFDPRSALAAAELLRLAGWLLLEPPGKDVGVVRALRMPSSPVTAGEHLSADVCLRFLPWVLKRARAFVDGGLADDLAGVLRAWPLSGVLSDLAEGPSDVGDLGRHPGLRMLYAERLALDEKPGWMPRGGEARDHVELVFRGLGRAGSRLFGPAADPREVEGVSLG